ncbi:hypothetical protein Ccrd_020077 [Cynara cardunculus var. scolymus]|uniref:Uncharacterized protein n=1 Tax=Cynara cardunculus var. scolymus TaxID=59895 RepID=A0A103Y354_CYNCS|nr:hypothetical protein Ccrd_020077 [Cynara cardunculus var. scolymus]
MKEAAKNGLRSGLVVIGALAFGYLTLQLGFKPYLEKAQLYNDDGRNPQSDEQQHSTNDAAAIILDDASPS